MRNENAGGGFAFPLEPPEPAERHAMSSRRSIPALETDLAVVVGWDNPMTTFFAYVRRESAKDEYDPPLLWIGTQEKACLRAEDLVVPLAPYATLTDELVDQLRADRALDADAAQARCSGPCAASADAGAGWRSAPASRPNGRVGYCQQVRPTTSRTPSTLMTRPMRSWYMRSKPWRQEPYATAPRAAIPTSVVAKCSRAKKSGMTTPSPMVGRKAT